MVKGRDDAVGRLCWVGVWVEVGLGCGSTCWVGLVWIHYNNILPLLGWVDCQPSVSGDDGAKRRASEKLRDAPS